MGAVRREPGQGLGVHGAYGSDGGGKLSHSTLWDDNFISLLPGESRQIRVRYRTDGVANGAGRIVVSGWNVLPQELPL